MLAMAFLAVVTADERDRTPAPAGMHRFGADGNGRLTPVVTAPTLATLLLKVISDPDGSYLAFAIDATGRCTLQDQQGGVDVLRAVR